VTATQSNLKFKESDDSRLTDAGAARSAVGADISSQIYESGTTRGSTSKGKSKGKGKDRGKGKGKSVPLQPAYDEDLRGIKTTNHGGEVVGASHAGARPRGDRHRHRNRKAGAVFQYSSFDASRGPVPAQLQRTAVLMGTQVPSPGMVPLSHLRASQRRTEALYLALVGYQVESSRKQSMEENEGTRNGDGSGSLTHLGSRDLNPNISSGQKGKRQTEKNSLPTASFQARSEATRRQVKADRAMHRLRKCPSQGQGYLGLESAAAAASGSRGTGASAYERMSSTNTRPGSRHRIVGETQLGVPMAEPSPLDMALQCAGDPVVGRVLSSAARGAVVPPLMDMFRRGLLPGSHAAAGSA